MLQESRYFVNMYDPFSQTKTTGITDSLRVMKSIAYALLDVINRAKADSGLIPFVPIHHTGSLTTFISCCRRSHRAVLAALAVGQQG